MFCGGDDNGVGGDTKSEEEGNGRGFLGGEASEGGSDAGSRDSFASGEACASNRDREEGRAVVGDEFERVRERVGNSCEFGGCVTSKVLSTSASGGPGGSVGALAARLPDLGSTSEVCFLDDNRLLL
jgi:hypothetical protein